MTWRDVSPEAVRSELAGTPLAVILFTLEDCVACATVRRALETLDFAALHATPLSVRFTDFNPAHLTAMAELRLAVFPHVRLYGRGLLLGAWESVTEGASDEDVREFTKRWMVRSLSLIPQTISARRLRSC